MNKDFTQNEIELNQALSNLIDSYIRQMNLNTLEEIRRGELETSNLTFQENISYRKTSIELNEEEIKPELSPKTHKKKKKCCILI
jgi:hypothetical protein